MKKIFKNQVLLVSLSFCLVFLLFAFVSGEYLNSLLNLLAKESLSKFGKFYLYLGFGAFFSIVFIAISPKGKLRLGAEPPEYSRFSWIAMLYSTGMGSGLMLRAIQEPFYYYRNPPNMNYGVENAGYALKYTFFHWGFTPWAFYALFGLFIAYFLYIKEKNILSSSFLEGKFRKKWMILLVDIVTVLSTLVGVIAMLGLGSKQLIGGLNFISKSELGIETIVLTVVLIGFCSTSSAFLGVRNSIRRISNFNIILAFFLLLFVCFHGDLAAILTNFAKSSFAYLRDFIPMSLNLGSHSVSHEFLTDWTYFYWAFWLAWAPFTGVFIARISKGRTIREFAIGTLLIPSIGTFLWFSAFATSGFELISNMANYDTRFDSIYSSIFVFLETLPLANISLPLTLLLVFTFLITSVDSAILVLGYYTETTKSKLLRVIWGFTIVLVTISLILIGQDELLLSSSNLLVLIGLPFSVLFSIMIGNFLIKLFR